MMDLPVYSAMQIQDAIDAAAVTTGVAQIPAGIYVATEPVRLMSNVKLVFDPAAILRRNFDTNEATLSQFQSQTKIANVSVSGGRIDNAATHPGPQISIFGDNISISDMQVLNFYSVVGGIGGNGINIAGNDNKLTNLTVVTTCTTTGAGGIRMLGGYNFLCSNCFVSSGDDALQFVPDPSQDISISNSQFVNCVGISAAARACAVFLENRDTGTMSASVTNCAFIGIRGRGGTVGAICSIKADPGTVNGSIANIQFIGVSLALPPNAPGPTFVVKGDQEPTSNIFTGLIDQIDFIGCTAGGGTDVAGPGLYVQQAARVRWIGGSIQAGTAATSAVSILSSADCEIRNATIICSSTCLSGISVGHGDGSRMWSERIAISGVTVMGFGSVSGIALSGTHSCIVSSNVLLSKSGGGSVGISVDNSDQCVLDGNNTEAVATPYDLSGSASGFIIAGPGAATQASGTATLSSGTAKVTFAVPFFGPGYTVQLTGDTPGETFSFSDITAESFVITSTNTGSMANVSWLALFTTF
jgi:hypothetical protein